MSEDRGTSMKCNIIVVYTLSFLIFNSIAQANTITKIVGKVGDYYLTSREVIGGYWLEKALQPEQKIIPNENINSPEFIVQVTSALLEKVVSLEAENFSLANVTDEEFKESLNKAKKNLANQKSWQKWSVTEAEIQDWLMRKLRSKKFLKYKTEASSLTVSEFEIKEYYEKNRLKFGSLPLESFRENIRQFLIQKQSEERLREWFDILRKKYQVRNFTAESNE